MKAKKWLILILLAAALAGAAGYGALRRPAALVLTGIVTTDEVVVSAEIPGRLERLLVREGDAVTNGQLVALLQAQEGNADVAFYARSEEQSAAQVEAAAAEVRYQEAQTSNQIRQAQATLEAAQAQVVQAEAELDIAARNFKRLDGLFQQGVESPQAYDQSRTTADAAKARLESLRQQAQAAQAAVGLAQASCQQVAVRRAALAANTHQQAAAAAQQRKARVRLDYTEIRAPADGVVDVRAALQGEVVSPAQAIVTLINPENLWVRADVEETYIDRIRLGETLAVRVPSGAQLQGTVFYRRVDADFATQRDVSRTKRDLKTFEIRLRCDNRERRLAVGMTAYVTLPLRQAAGPEIAGGAR